MRFKKRVVFNRKFNNARVRLVVWGMENNGVAQVERSEDTDAMGRPVWLPSDFTFPAHRREFMRALGAYALAKRLRCSNQS